MTREEIVNSMSLQDAIQVFKDTNTYGTMDIAKSVILKALKQKPILDKIKAEIEQEYNRLRAKRTDETLELGECLGLKMSLKIIDKYEASPAGAEGSEKK